MSELVRPSSTSHGLYSDLYPPFLTLSINSSISLLSLCISLPSLVFGVNGLSEVTHGTSHAIFLYEARSDHM